MVNRIKQLLNWLLIKLFHTDKQPIQSVVNTTKHYNDQTLGQKKNKFHKRLDHLWKNKHTTRGNVYYLMTKEYGEQFHVSKLKTNLDFVKAYNCLQKVENHIRTNKIISDAYNDPRIIHVLNKPLKRKVKKFK